jgi:hypothetical protein
MQHKRVHTCVRAHFTNCSEAYLIFILNNHLEGLSFREELKGHHAQRPCI